MDMYKSFSYYCTVLAMVASAGWAAAQEQAPRPGVQQPPLFRFFAQADKDGDGNVTFEQLREVMPNLTQERFDRLDANGDGVLTRAEVRVIARRIAGAPARPEAGPVRPDRPERLERPDRPDRPDRPARPEAGPGPLAPPEEAPGPPARPARPPLGALIERADADGDGKVTFDELKVVLPNLTQERFDRMDRNGDGAVTREEIAQWRELRGEWPAPRGDAAPRPPRGERPDDRPAPRAEGVRPERRAPQAQQQLPEGALERFRAADADGDGKLTFEELRSRVPDLRREWFDFMDRNGDGTLTEDEIRIPRMRGGQPPRGQRG